MEKCVDALGAFATSYPTAPPSPRVARQLTALEAAEAAPALTLPHDTLLRIANDLIEFDARRRSEFGHLQLSNGAAFFYLDDSALAGASRFVMPAEVTQSPSRTAVPPLSCV